MCSLALSLWTTRADRVQRSPVWPCLQFQTDPSRSCFLSWIALSGAFPPFLIAGHVAGSQEQQFVVCSLPGQTVCQTGLASLICSLFSAKSFFSWLTLLCPFISPPSLQSSFNILLNQYYVFILNENRYNLMSSCHSY